MLAHVYSCAVIGLEGVIIDIEVDYGQGGPHMAIVGLPDEAVIPDIEVDRSTRCVSS